MLKIQSTGKELAENFLSDRLLSSKCKFQDPIPKVKVPSFSPNKKIRVQQSNEVKMIEANRYIISRLFAISTKTNRPVNLEVALSYSLYHVPLSLANPNETKRATSKSTLLSIITTKRCYAEPDFVRKDNIGYVIDMIAQLRTCLTGITGTFEDLIKRFVGSLEKGCKRINIVADTYRWTSIKAGERLKRGCSSKVIIGSIRSKLPSDIKSFMLNDDNKTNLINLVFKYIIENKAHVLTSLNTQEIYLPGETRTV